MKKFIIAMLCVAVLFGFAACDNSTGNPADTDTTTSTPVSEAAQLRSAAQFVESLLYTPVSAGGMGTPATAPIINVVDIINSASEYNASFADEKLTITREYPEGGNVVGEVTVVLSGTYKAPTDKDTADGTLDVNDYTVSATDLKILGNGDYQTISFSVTAPVKGIVIESIKADGSSWAYEVNSQATIYAPLPDQAASATVTIPVVVSYSADDSAIPTVETKKFDSGLVAVLSTLLSKGSFDPQSYVITDVIGNASGSGYLAQLKTPANLAQLITDVTTMIGKTPVTGLTTVTPNWSVDDSKSDTTNNVGTVTLSVEAKNYKMGTASISGTFALSFDGKQPVSATEIALTNLVITGSINLEGCDYPITLVSSAENHPIAAKEFKNLNAVLNSAAEGGAIESFAVPTSQTISVGDLTGIATVEGFVYELPVSTT